MRSGAVLRLVDDGCGQRGYSCSRRDPRQRSQTNTNGGEEMLRTIVSRVTYANLMATGAMFVALGGGAYAVTVASDPDRVFHGCVNNRSGVLRVVERAGACARAHGRGRHRRPGETAINWNRRGPKGAVGARGPQ